MSKVLILKGLPASGKSTYARELVEAGNWTRVNKDDLRLLLHNSKWSRAKERLVEDIRDRIIVSALLAGQNVIVDDTNLAARHETRIRNVIKNTPDLLFLKSKPEVEVKTFDISVDEAIARDEKRKPTVIHHKVGAKVIRSMYNQFFRKLETPEKLINVPKVVICDLDGTLALFGKNNPYDRDFSEDKANEAVVRTLRMFRDSDPSGTLIIIFSGRKGKYEKQTREWLYQNSISYDQLFMRAEGDDRKDVVVKRELYDKYVRGNYNVIAVFDDRPQVCRLWYELGLPLFKVGDPDADF